MRDGGAACFRHHRTRLALAASPASVTLPAVAWWFPGCLTAIPNEFVSRIAAFPQARRRHPAAFGPDQVLRVFTRCAKEGVLAVTLRRVSAGGGAFWG